MCDSCSANTTTSAFNAKRQSHYDSLLYNMLRCVKKISEKKKREIAVGFNFKVIDDRPISLGSFGVSYRTTEDC